MSKDIHTPREELICGAIDRAEDIARAHSLVYLMDELSRIRIHAERMEAKLVSRKQEAEHHSLHVQALKSELAALKAGQGEAVAWVHPNYLASGMENWAFEASRVRLSPLQVPLYTAPPATADAVSVPRELLERLETWVVEDCSALEDLRALLAQSLEVKS